MRDWHLNFLEATHTRKLNIQKQASLANKRFALQINSIFANLSADPVLERLRLQQKPLTDSEVQQQVDDAKHFLNLCYEMAAQRAWTMSSNSEVQPNNWVGLCDQDLELAASTKRKIKHDAGVIQRAHNLSQPEAGSEVSKARFESEKHLWYPLVVFRPSKQLYNIKGCPSIGLVNGWSYLRIKFPKPLKFTATDSDEFILQSGGTERDFGRSLVSQAHNGSGQKTGTDTEQRGG